MIADVDGLLDSECPVEWACDHLLTVGYGERATVFAYPGRADLVIRISDYPDGWFAHASGLNAAEEMGDGGAWRRHGPVAHDMVFKDGYYLAVCERLDRIHDEDTEALEWVETARLIMAHKPVEAEQLARFNRAQPDFSSFLRWCPAKAMDIYRMDNWMLRGRYLVLNDPYASMSPAEEAGFQQEYAFAEEAETCLSPQP